MTLGGGRNERSAVMSHQYALFPVRDLMEANQALQLRPFLEAVNLLVEARSMKSLANLTAFFTFDLPFIRHVLQPPNTPVSSNASNITFIGYHTRYGYPTIAMRLRSSDTTASSRAYVTSSFFAPSTWQASTCPLPQSLNADTYAVSYPLINGLGVLKRAASAMDEF